MARVIPATLELLGTNDLLGLIQAGKGAEILDVLLRRLNWHYATHAPAFANICPLPGGFAATPTEARWRCKPSADGRTYHSRWAIYMTTPTPQTADLDLQESTAWGGPWTSVGTYPQIGVLVNPGLNRYTFDAPLSPSTNYLRCIATNLTGAQASAQLQNFALAPKELTVIPSGVQPSGFTAYNDAALLVGSGDAPIHTEYFDRAARGVRATARDLRQCVMSYVQLPTLPTYSFTATATKTLQRMALTPFHIPLTAPTGVTVYCRAEDTGSPDGLVRVGQLGSQYEPATFTADDTDGELTLTLDHQAPPALYIDAINPGTRLDIRYVMVEWRPEVGSTSPIIAGISPPPLREYLAALDYLTLDAVLRDYAVTGLNFNGPDAAGGVMYLGQQVQPGVSGMRLLAAVSRDGAGSAGAPVRVQTATSGAAAADTILVESPTGGAYVYPPGPLANVVYGSNAWIPVPSDPNGSYRLAELTKSRRPAWEEMWYDRAHAASGVPIRVEDVASLPTP